MEAQESKFSIDLKDVIPQITAELKEVMTKKMQESFSYEVQSAIRAETQKYIQTEIAPAVAAQLKDSHVQLRAAFVAAVGEVAAAVSVKIVEDAKKKIAGYDGDAIVKELFTRIFKDY